LSDVETTVFTTAVVAARHPGVVLLDSPGTASQLQHFFDAFQPERVVVVGPASNKALLSATGKQTERLPWEGVHPLALWQELSLTKKRLVVCPAHSRRMLLQSACLAGVLEAPLYVLDEAADLHRDLASWRTQEVFATGDTWKSCPDVPGTRVVRLADERAVVDSYLRHLEQKYGPLSTLVIANPADGPGGMAALAPWVALQKHAALLLTDDTGDNADILVATALQDRRLQHADTILLVANLTAIPPKRRPNPAPGKDASIEMEPLTPTGSEPFSFATGRLFHKDTGLVTLMLARQRLLRPAEADSFGCDLPRKALVVGNPTGGLPLLETFSRNTALELRNGGYETTALFGKEATKETIRRLLPQQDVFLWEGHHSTMTRDYGLPGWPEPLKPSLVFLQSCLALCETDAQPLLERGAIGIVGTSTRTYSASGGACSLAFFDALLYQHQSLGASLRHAKNFLLAYTLLKEKRLGEDAKLRGANLRSAWAFSLWGDPTLQLPRPRVQGAALLSVNHEVHGNTIILRQPDETYEKVTSENYRARMLPNARLAGLVYKDTLSADRQLVPLLFAEVSLPKAPSEKTPSLRSRVPADHWVFCWDQRRRAGYLLVTPRPKDQGELRFHVDWKERASEAEEQGSDQMTR
jgi:hypothetical protein